MTVIELKEKLIAKIQETDDEQMLEHISDIMEYEHTGEIHEMSAGALEAVKEGLEQLDRGEWISNEEVDKQVKEWLNK